MLIIYIYIIYYIYIYHREEIHYAGCHPVIAADPNILDEFEWDATSLRRTATACGPWDERCVSK